MPSAPKKILGIDPGLSNTGYGIIEHSQTGSRLIAYGNITTAADKSFSERLGLIAAGIQRLIAAYRPEALAIEELFFAKNVKTALKVGQAKGAVIAAFRHTGLPVYEYTPLQVKLAITGYGRADKTQMQKMVQIILRLPTLPTPSHAADALAVALCCANGTDWSVYANQKKR